MRSFATLTTTTKSPVSTCGVYSGLFLPRRRAAIWVASRPSTLPCASTTNQPCLISPVFAVNVVISFRSAFREKLRILPINGAASDYIAPMVQCNNYLGNRSEDGHGMHGTLD